MRVYSSRVTRTKFVANKMLALITNIHVRIHLAASNEIARQIFR